jgi:hypothetical protein
VHAAAGTFDLKILKARIEGVTNRWGWLCGAAIALHAIIPGVAGRDICNEPRLPGALFRVPDRFTPLALF